MFRGKNKYKAKPCRGFPSRLEASLYDLLSLREKAGEIRNIRRQHVVVLQDGPKDVRINWKIDFSAEVAPDWHLELFEAKGIQTADYKIKLKLYKKNPPAPLEIYFGSYRKRDGESCVVPKLVERVEKKRAA